MRSISALEKELQQNGLVAILRGVPEDKLIPVVDALVAGGIRFVEITLGSPGDLNGIASLADRTDVVAGAGTVKSVDDARAAIAVGAKFLVCPATDVEVIRLATEVDVIPMPGVMTPTEMITAMRAGANTLKLFPASVLGPAYIKAVRAPLPEVKLFAVGGIDEHNAKDYLAAGAIGLGVGSTLTPKEAIACENYAEITRRAKALVEALKK